MSERSWWRTKVVSFVVFALVVVFDWLVLKPETLHSLVADYHHFTFHRSFKSEKATKPLGGITRLSIEVDAVDVDVSSSSTADSISIELEGLLPAIGDRSHLSLETTDSGAVARVREWPETFWIRKFEVGDGVQALLRVTLPKRFSGEVSFVSNSGRGTFRNMSLAKLEAESKSGIVSVADSDVHVMRITNVTGPALLGVRSQDVVVETDSGDVIANFYDAPETGRANLEFRTHAGDLTLAVDPKASLHVELESLSGEVVNTIPLSDRAGKNERKIVGNLGTGQGVLSAKSWSGSIRLDPIDSARNR